MLRSILLGLWVFFGSWLAFGQIIIIPPYPPRPIPPSPPTIPPVARPFEYRELSLEGQAQDQAAEVRMTQVVANPGETPLEAEFLFPVPPEAAVGNLVLLIDGKEVVGQLLDKNEARQVYEDIVRRQRDPALLEYAGQGLYRTSVFPIPAKSERKLTLRYTQLLVKDRDRLAWRLPLSGGAPPQKFSVRITWSTSAELKSIYAPTHAFRIERPDPKRARLELATSSTLGAQFSDIQLYAITAREPVGATLLSWQSTTTTDGYALFLASPGLKASSAPPQPQSVLFVLDRSGSMQGAKFKQAQGALRYVLKQLRDGDTFNVVAYDDQVDSWRPAPVIVDEAQRASALTYVDDLRPGGGTNIAGALTTALAQLTTTTPGCGYVLFLTDGLPTAGETRELAIAAAARRANARGARLLVWGVGDDVNARLLDRLAAENSGASEYVRPEEDIEAGVSRVFARMTDPVLTSPTLSLQGVVFNRVYPARLPDLFAGSQLVVVARYTHPGKGTATLSGLVGGEQQKFDFPVELAGPGGSAGREWIGRLWATRRIGALVDQIDLNGPNAELTNELVALSRQFGIVTPYTSFLAREDVALHDQQGQAVLAGGQLQSLDTVSGRVGTGQRLFKQEMLRSAAPAPASSNWSMGDARLAMGSVSGTPTPGSVAPDENESPGRQMVQTIGAKTFFWKNQRWEDADSASGPAQEPRPVKQFADEWFALIRELPPSEARYLAMPEPTLVRLGGQIYLIAP